MPDLGCSPERQHEEHLDPGVGARDDPCDPALLGVPPEFAELARGVDGAGAAGPAPDGPGGAGGVGGVGGDPAAGSGPHPEPGGRDTLRLPRWWDDPPPSRSEAAGATPGRPPLARRRSADRSPPGPVPVAPGLDGLDGAPWPARPPAGPPPAAPGPGFGLWTGRTPAEDGSVIVREGPIDVRLHPRARAAAPPAGPPGGEPPGAPPGARAGDRWPRPGDPPDREVAESPRPAEGTARPAPPAAVPVADRSPLRRLVSALGLALSVAAAVAVAVLVLVVLRWPHRPAAPATTPVDAVVAQPLLADRVLSVAAWIENVASLLVVGGAAFRVLVRRPVSLVRGPAERLLVVAALVGIGACLGSLPLRVMVMSGRGPGALADLDAVGLVATSSFLDAACLRIVALGGFALALARPPRGWERRLRVIRPSATVLVFGSIAPRTVERLVLVAGTAATLASFAVVGHPQATEPRWPLVLSQSVHVGAAAVWFGGGVVLALEIVRQRREGDPGCSAETVARFSTLAGAALALVAVSGLVLARSQLASLGALVSTAYGRALSAKLALVAVVVAIGTYNHLRLVPAVVRDDDAVAWRRLGRTAAVEGAVIAAGVLVTTAAMTSGGI